MTNNYDRFIKDNRGSQPTANCWSFPNELLLRSYFGVSLVLLWLSYRALKWIRCSFKQCLKVMRRYTPLTEISSLAHEAVLIVPRTCVIKRCPHVP